MHIRKDDLRSDPVLEFMREHLEEMKRVSPPGSVHALEIAGLRAPDVMFWTAWQGDQLAGCGGLKMLDNTTGEIKAMRTAAVFRGQGVASFVLRHIVHQAAGLGLTRLYLETGAQDAFAPARNLYLRHDFELCGPFGAYEDTGHSVFMTRALG